MADERCETCRFWARETKPIGGANAGEYGECRRNPPTIPDRTQGFLGYFPQVYRLQWCGQYQHFSHTKT